MTRFDASRGIKFAALVYALGLALHTADHLRRGLEVLTPEVQWAGNLSTLFGITAVALVLTNNRFGPLTAALTGVPVALGVAAVHLLPHWSAFSDSFPDAHGTGVSALSWTVVSIEIIGALAMGVCGLLVLREQHRSMPTR